MTHPRVPTEESSFGPLARDLAHLVFVGAGSLPYLLLLKSVSRSVANAVRRAVTSEEFMALKFPGPNAPHCHMSDALQGCALSFPMRVGYDFLRSSSYLCDLEEPSVALVLHEFHLEFRYRDNVVTNPAQVTEWIAKVWDYEDKIRRVPRDYSRETLSARDEHLSAMAVTCTRFCVERPGVGIFHSVDTLWHHLDFPKEHREAIRFSLEKHTSPKLDYHFVSSLSAHRALELACRLHPYTHIGGKIIFFKTLTLNNDGHTHTLLSNILWERLHGQRF